VPSNSAESRRRSGGSFFDRRRWVSIQGAPTPAASIPSLLVRATWISGDAVVLRFARSRKVGIVTEMLLTKAEQVSDEGGPPDYAWSGSPGVDAVVTGLVLAASRRSVVAGATIGPVRLQRGTLRLWRRAGTGASGGEIPRLTRARYCAGKDTDAVAPSRSKATTGLTAPPHSRREGGLCAAIATVLWRLRAIADRASRWGATGRLPT
jgi:hypothetical protein